MADVSNNFASTASQTVCSSFDELRATKIEMSSVGDMIGLSESALPRDVRTRIHKLFDRIEREYEREYQKLYAENYALQEKLDKYEEGDHFEPLSFSKKLTASQLSSKIKQQYKQSTSRLVSSLRPASGGLTLPSTTNPLGSTAASLDGSGGVYSTSLSGRNTVSLSWGGTASGYPGSWRHVNQFVGHRDGIWEVTCFHNLFATASADTTVRLWSNAEKNCCLLVYSGHSGSVNSVRFRNFDNLMLTCSGDGSAHLTKVPRRFLVDSSARVSLPNTSTTATSDTSEGILSTSPGQKDGKVGLLSDQDTEIEVGHQSTQPMILRDPVSIFQSACLTFGDGPSSALSEGTLDSLPLAASDFLSGRDQIVTASWDRLGRVYDLNTGQEIQALTGHDDQLTDVRCADNNLPVVVTASRDSTFRLWDFRAPCLEIHVQQAHNRTVTTAQFLPGSSPDLLISAGTDRLCRLWDLRNSRAPLFTIRSDAGINRLAVLRTSVCTESRQISCQPDSNSRSGTATAAATISNSSTTVISSGCLIPQSYIFALPLDNRTVKLVDMNGSRIGRIPRNVPKGHTRSITSAAWAEEGLCNLFTVGFDCKVIGWLINVP